MKKDIFMCLTVFILLGAFLGSTRVLEPVQPGEELNIFWNIHNTGEEDLDNTNVRAIIFDFPEYVVSPSFELDSKSVRSGILSVRVPKDAEKGDHIMRISASNDNFYSNRHIYFRVI